MRISLSTVEVIAAVSMYITNELKLVVSKDGSVSPPKVKTVKVRRTSSEEVGSIVVELE